MHTSSPSPYSPSPTRRSLSPSPAMLAPSGSSGVGFTPPSPLRGRTQSFGSAPQGIAHGHHHGHAIHSSSTTSLPTRSGILPSHTHTTTASLQQVSKEKMYALLLRNLTISLSLSFFPTPSSPTPFSLSNRGEEPTVAVPVETDPPPDDKRERTNHHFMFKHISLNTGSHS